MITVQHKQMDALRSAMNDRLIDRLARRLPERFPALKDTLSEDGLRTFVSEGIDHAHGYGLRSEAQLRFFIDLMAIHGRNFDISQDTAWAGLILDDPRLSPQEKLVRLDEVQAILDKEAL